MYRKTRALPFHAGGNSKELLRVWIFLENLTFSAWHTEGLGCVLTFFATDMDIQRLIWDK